MKTFSCWQALAPILLAAGILLPPASAQAAGGAFVVDDVEIDKPGNCQVESWVSTAANRDFSAVAAPACVAKLGIPVELGGQFQRSRTDSVWSSSGTFKAKANLIPVENHPFGLGIAGGSAWDMGSGAHTGGYVYVPATFQVREKLRINVDGGWYYDNVTKISYATWGAGFEWNFIKPVTLIGEVYGQAGQLAGVESGQPALAHRAGRAAHPDRPALHAEG